MSRPRALIRLAPALALSGCGGPPWQSSLHPAGPLAGKLAELIWTFTIVCAVVWVLVMLALAWALLRARRPRREEPTLEPDPARERRIWTVIGTATGLTVLVLIALNVWSYLADKSLAGVEGKEALTIQLTGHQWWWEVTYQDPQPARTLTTANEIHIPVGRPVKVTLMSGDVIHSFWVPNLTGKTDLIPGQNNQIMLLADRPGPYRGQCAEFCGPQHAHMALLVVADPPDAFQAWWDGQLRPADPPADPLRQRGRQVLESQPCVMCHTVRGTQAAGKVAPDLTHLASRRTLAAGTLPNNRGNLAAWIVDPQTIKPGAQMPTMTIPPSDLQALLAYLEGLR
ncbi:MAG TPA: cytochrome c oxidase subunit II, partial [Phenylobacterium sp.]